MGAKWFWGIVILAILSLLWALYTAPGNSDAMGEDIRNALRSAGSNAEVDMNGNVATLTGVAKTDDEMARASQKMPNVRRAKRIKNSTLLSRKGGIRSRTTCLSQRLQKLRLNHLIPSML